MKKNRPENDCEKRKHLQTVKKTHTETGKDTDYEREREKMYFFWFVAASQMCSDPVVSTFSLMWW